MKSFIKSFYTRVLVFNIIAAAIIDLMTGAYPIEMFPFQINWMQCTIHLIFVILIACIDTFREEITTGGAGE